MLWRRYAVGLLALVAAALPVAAGDATEEKAPKKNAPLWSLQPVVEPAVPAGFTRSSNPIDAFIAEAYREKGLRPVGPAGKLALLRRVYLDLIGIPPTPAEQDAFLSDKSPDAYERVVDRLLGSEQHGVRYARHWLDVLRYSDIDDNMPAASGIHLWRDWVITALNRDMPYDEFVRAQITGSRSKEHTTMAAVGIRSKIEGRPEDMLALGFLARGAASRDNQGQDLAINAVETISSAFMGLTVACAKCHDHRYDPILRKDYYSMKALFDPLVEKKAYFATPSEVFAYGRALDEYEKKKAALDAQINPLVGPYKTKLYNDRLVMLPAEAQAAIRKPEKERSLAEMKAADDYYPILRIDPEKILEVMTKEDAAKYKELLDRTKELKPPPDLLTFWTVEEDSKLLEEKHYVLTTGDPMRPEKNQEVQPGFPFMPAGTDFREGRREGFVDWLTAPANPLFARVAVNRIWQWHFGEGIHRTPSDFGNLGGKPTNQKLLDWLAAEFVSHDYDMKWLHRLIVTSDTYRLDSRADAALITANQKADPNDTYLWRFRLQRLDAEPIWDSILYDSGDLDLSVGGKSFLLTEDKPQDMSEGIFDSGTNRRAVYMARGYQPSHELMPHFLQVFDADDGRAVCPLRTQTVTAPQSLLLMNNDRIEREAARLADRVVKQSPGDLRGAVTLAYRTTLGRPPSSAEMDKALTYIANDNGRLKGFAWMLFNLDEFLYVR